MVPRATLLVSILTLLWACGDAGQSPAAPQTRAQPAVVERSATLSGYATYQEFCAHCHDTGANGAPVTGNRADWTERSQLWVAVLTEHAKAGYLDMPARGGQSDLSDLTVSHAVEYMMRSTFPEKPSG